MMGSFCFPSLVLFFLSRTFLCGNLVFVAFPRVGGGLVFLLSFYFFGGPPFLDKFSRFLEGFGEKKGVLA